MRLIKVRVTVSLGRCILRECNGMRLSTTCRITSPGKVDMMAVFEMKVGGGEELKKFEVGVSVWLAVMAASTNGSTS